MNFIFLFQYVKDSILYSMLLFKPEETEVILLFAFCRLSLWKQVIRLLMTLNTQAMSLINSYCYFLYQKYKNRQYV